MDGGVEKRKTLLFVSSTPQSIAKPSPGWNKVALLTAVRNSPCSCPFSVSLTRPQDALNSEPRRGSLFGAPLTKSCPRTRWRLLVRFTNSHINNQGDGLPSPQLYNLPRSPAVRRISHGAAIFHIAKAIFHPFVRTDFTARKRAYSIPSSAVSIASSVFPSFAVSAAANCAFSGWHRALRL